MSSETQFGTWSVADSPYTVQYSLVVIEEIRNAVADGYQKFSRGGIEVGGILYGILESNAVRILATRRIACEHAMGPSFLLSQNDKDALRHQLEHYADDAALGGLTVVGWYVSHTRSEIQLTEQEQEIFNQNFPAPWQVAMVVRPAKAGAMRAGFFVREPDGSLKSDASHHEFDFPDRLGGLLDRPRKARGEEQHAYPSIELPPSDFDAQLQEREQPSFVPSSSSSSLLGSQPVPESGSHNGWSWVIVALLVMATAAVAVVGLRYLTPQLINGSKNDPLALAVYERDGQVRIQWNHLARPVKAAAKGLLSIKDGEDGREIPITAKDLATGSFTYPRKGGDVQVRLVVESEDGEKTEEASTFLGGTAQPRDSNELDALRLERDSLQDEANRLRVENVKQAERIRQLERAMVILRSRLGIEQGQR